MKTSTVHEHQWRSVTAAVRREYSGLLTYAANPNEYPHMTWWDALDMIGVNAYFSLSTADTPTVDDMVAGWQPDPIDHQALRSRVRPSPIGTSDRS